ncbi:MAG: nuclear transport factor 2 family protein [Alphaproteobacteria bacterium]
MKIVMISVSTISLLLLPFSAVSEENITPEQAPCFDLIAGWYGGDASKMAEFMHESFIKKGVLVSPSTGKTVTTSHDKEQFIAAVATERELSPKEEWDISAKTVHLRGNIATVEVQSRDLVDVCQVGKINGEWQIMNVIWTFRGD